MAAAEIASRYLPTEHNAPSQEIPAAKADTTINPLLQPQPSYVRYAAHLAAAPPLSAGLADLNQQLQAAFAAEKKVLGPGAQIDYNHALVNPESFQRLDAAVRTTVQQYAAQHADWQEMVKYNPHHYVRHLVDSCPEYELILICWAPGQVSRVHSHDNSHCWLTCLSGAVQEKEYGLQDSNNHAANNDAADGSIDNNNNAAAANTDGHSSDGSGPSSSCNNHAVVSCASSGTSSSSNGTSKPAQGRGGVVLPTISGPCPLLQCTATTTLQAGQTGYINDHLCLHSVGCAPETPLPGSVTLHLYAPPIKKVWLYEPDVDKVSTRSPGFISIRGQPV